MSSKRLGRSNVQKTSNRIQPFLVVIFDGKSFAVRRNPDYAATISSIRRAFPLLDQPPLGGSRIQLSAKLGTLGGSPVGINDELWAELLPDLDTVLVSVVDEGFSLVDPSPRQTPEARRSRCNEAERTTVCVIDVNENIPTLNLPLAVNSTIRQLKDLIIQHDRRIPPDFDLFLESSPKLDNSMQLVEIDGPDPRTFFLSTEIEICLVGPSLSKRTVQLPIFATIRTLKLINFARIQSSEETPIHPCRQALTCTGELMDEKRTLSTYPQLFMECEVYVNVVQVSQNHPLPEIVTVRMREEASLYEEEDGEVDHYRLLPDSTVLDLKILVSCRTGAPFARLLISDWFHKCLEDDFLILDHYNPEGHDNIWLTVCEQPMDHV